MVKSGGNAALDKTMKKPLFYYSIETEITQNIVSVPLSTVTATEEYMYSDSEGGIRHDSESPRTGATYLRKIWVRDLNCFRMQL